MNRFVNTYNEIVGFHRYPTAPQFCLYLAAKHRHVFVIRASFRVEHNNRQLEINQQQNEIKTYLLDKYSTQEYYITVFASVNPKHMFCRFV